MINASLGYEQTPPPITPVNILIQETPTGVNYTELGIFISGLLLSLGGCFAVIASQCRKSNCSKINCCGLKIVRENLEIEDP